ncbi:hypothetical protein ACFWC5_16650 [Streptomyces sp. NPDC060085]|uniref:hypothetical protein n=1 Tax=Streptomyces sp. NPDC060085 TaxID=3347054 RepID=UPI00364BC459
MDAVPAFVDQLLDQGSTPGDIPEIPVANAAGWLSPLAVQLLDLVERGMPGAPAGAFLAHGYAHLPLRARDGCGLYLRMAYGSAVTRWPNMPTAVVLTVHGSLYLEMHQRIEDLVSGRPQYARHFGPGEFFAVHPGTVCTLQSSAGGLQILAVIEPESVPSGLLSFTERGAVIQRVHRTLKDICAAPVGGAR